MVQVAGFDPLAIPAGPAETRRQPEREPDSNRITPINEGEELRADRRRQDAEEAAKAEPLTRVAFTAKFGPDKDGFPLQLVRGEEVTGAEKIDFELIASRRISREDRAVLLRAQEEQNAAQEAARRRQEQTTQSVDRTDSARQAADQIRRDTAAAEAESRYRIDTRLDLQV